MEETAMERAITGINIKPSTRMPMLQEANASVGRGHLARIKKRTKVLVAQAIL